MTYPAQSPVPYDDWFPPNPLDSMPIATDKGGFDWEDTAPCEYEPPEEEITMHEKMYRMATKNSTLMDGASEKNMAGGSSSGSNLV